MNRLHSLQLRLRVCSSLAALAAVCYWAAPAPVVGADKKAADPNPAVPKLTDPKAEPKLERKKLTGAELYAVHCNRCHPERYPTERTPAQWKTLMTHMRVRANLPAAQAREILKYLQEESGK